MDQYAFFAVKHATSGRFLITFIAYKTINYGCTDDKKKLLSVPRRPVAENKNVKEAGNIAGHDRSGAPLVFRSEVLFYDLHLKSGNTIQSPNLDGFTGFIYLFSESATIEGDGGEAIQEGDSIIIKDEQLSLNSNKDSDMVFFILDEKAPYSRNGLYAK